MTTSMSRDDLLILLEEWERGEFGEDELRRRIEALELVMADEQAIDLVQNEELSSAQIADQILGYPEDDA